MTLYHGVLFGEAEGGHIVRGLGSAGAVERALLRRAGTEQVPPGHRLCIWRESDRAVVVERDGEGFRRPPRPTRKRPPRPTRKRPPRRATRYAPQRRSARAQWLRRQLEPGRWVPREQMIRLLRTRYQISQKSAGEICAAAGVEKCRGYQLGYRHLPEANLSYWRLPDLELEADKGQNGDGEPVG